MVGTRENLYNIVANSYPGLYVVFIIQLEV